MTGRRWLAAAAAGCVAAGLWGGAAGAQVEPPPPDTQTTTTTAAPPTTAAPGNQTPAQQTADEVKGILFGPQIGQYPDSRYRFYTGDGHAELSVPDVPGPLDDIVRALPGGDRSVTTPVPTDDTATGKLTAYAWEFTQMLAALVRDFTLWLFDLSALRIFTPVIDTVAGLLNGAVLGPLRLREIVGVVLGIALAWRVLMRRRYSSVLTDLGIAIVLFAAALLMIEKPGVYFDGLSNAVSSVVQLPFRLINPGDDDAGRDETLEALKRVQTELPWQVVNFNHQLTGPCVDAGNEILAGGPYSMTDNTPRETLLKAGCRDEAEYNNEPTPARFILTVLLGFAIFWVTAFVASMMWTFGHAFLRLVWSFCYAGPALLIGAVPATREMAVGWIRSVVDSVVAMVVPAWVLACMLVADRVLLRPEFGAWGTTVQLALVGAMNAAIFWKRKKVINAVAARLSGSVGAVSARVVASDQSLEATRHRAENHAARDYMPGHQVLTAPTMAAAAAVGTQIATGGKTLDKTRSAAATVVGGPAGKAAVAAKSAASSAKGAKDEASAAGLGVMQKVGARVASRKAAVSDAQRGTGFAPLGDVHGPPKPPTPKPSPDADLVPGVLEEKAETRAAARAARAATARAAAEPDAEVA